MSFMRCFERRGWQGFALQFVTPHYREPWLSVFLVIFLSEILSSETIGL